VVLRVVIAEDSFLVRQGIREVLASQSDLAVVGVCADLPELLATVAEHRPHVVVTDVRMPPGMSDEGVRAAAEFRQTCPEMGVVVLSQYAEPAYATPLLADGSAGRAYLLKERVSDPGQLAAVVRAVAAGGSFIDPVVVEVLVKDSLRRKTSPLAALSPRERDVLAHIAAGKSNAAVGAALFLTERAVEKHINAIFAKLCLSAEPDINRRVTAVLMYLSAAGAS
jgi:DNA-binding NarL/FixJ family response regulator